MHAPAEFQVSVTRFGAWRAGLAGLGAAVWGCGLAWALATERAPASPAGMLLWLACAGATLALFTLGRVRPFQLRWDTRCWHLTPGASEPQAGTLRVAIDAGAWLLLQFVPHPPGSGAPRWLPVQRRGLGATWHRFRSTLFGAPGAGQPP